MGKKKRKKKVIAVKIIIRIRYDAAAGKQIRFPAIGRHGRRDYFRRPSGTVACGSRGRSGVAQRYN